MVKTIHIAEKSMTGLFGHYADVTSRICSAFSKIQVKPIVYCNTAIDQSCSAFFETKGVQLEKQLQSSTLNRFEKIAARPIGFSRYKKFRKTVFPSFGGLPDSDLFDAPLFVASAEISDVLTSLVHRREHGVILAFWASPTIESDNAFTILAKALRKHGGSNITLGAYDEFTFKELQQLESLVRVVKLPAPYDDEIGNRTPSSSANHSIGFLGWMREERGKSLLEHLQTECRKLSLEVIDARSELKRDHVVYSAGHSYERPLGDVLSKCDLVVWPSDPSRYEKRTSGIVFHCLANGVPVVVPENTLPSRILESYGLSYPRITRITVEDVMVSVKKHVVQMSQNQSMSQRAKTAFKLREGTDNLATTCLEILS
jgi:hypothetical protein